MRKFLILLFGIILLIGCTGSGDLKLLQKSKNISEENKSNEAAIVRKPVMIETKWNENCMPSYNFADMPEGSLGKKSKLTGMVSCAYNKTIVVKLNDKIVAQIKPVKPVNNDINDIIPVSLDVLPLKDGMQTLSIELNGEQIYSKEWRVMPLGLSDTRGNEYDPVSFKEWRAMAIEIEGPTDISRVRVFMKRFQVQADPTQKIQVEIRPDENNNLSNLILGKTNKLMKSIGLNENWVNFDFEPLVTLSPRRYWIIIKVPQEENLTVVSDVVSVHAIVNDKYSEGNKETRQMRLNVNREGIASETTWEPLSYDRHYSIILQSK